MKHLFTPYELALLAKEKGYNEQDFAYYRLSFEEEKEPFKAVELGWFKEHYDNHNFRLSLSKSALNPICTAPLYQQIIDWFREEHSIRFKLEPYSSQDDVELFLWHILGWRYIGKYKNDYEALNKAIEEAFKLI